MKKYFFESLIILIVLASCNSDKVSEDKMNVFTHNWQDTDRTIIENRQYHTTGTLDSVNNRLAGDTLFPIIMLPNDRIIVQNHWPKEMHLLETDTSTSLIIVSTEFKTDTMSYQLINLDRQSFLILFSENTGNKVLKSKGNIFVNPFKTTDQQPVVALKSLSIGQMISPETIDILEEESFGPIAITYAVLKSNENFYIRLKQGLFIDQIEHLNMPEKEARELIKTYTSVFGVPPEITDSVNEYDFPPSDITSYYWSEKDVSVSIDFVRTASWDENEEVKESWNVIINNYIITKILEQLYTPEEPAV